MIRSGGDGMRRDIAEVFDRLTDLQLCAEAVVKRTRDRNEKLLSVLGGVVKQVQTNMVADMEASAEMWKRVVDTKKRWVREYDWYKYDDARLADMLRKKTNLKQDSKLPALSSKPNLSRKSPLPVIKTRQMTGPDSRVAVCSILCTLQSMTVIFFSHG